MQGKFVSPTSSIKITPSARHRRQMTWQVWVPLFASILIVLALAVLSIVGAAQGSDQIERWGSISAVLVILPVLLFGLVYLAIVGGLAFGIIWLLKRMPDWLLKAQLFMLHLALMIRRAADASTKPVVAVNTFSARVGRLWNTLFHRHPAP